MKTYNAKRAGTKVVTGMVRLSYAHLFEPHSVDDSSTPKYSVSLIIPKSDKLTLQAIKEATEEAKENAKSLWGGKIPANLKTPLRDGDVDRPDDEAYENAYFINANSKRKPEVVDLKGNALGPDEVYSGCYARVSINLYGFNISGNRGIACGLGNVQKLDDGERLGGGSTAEEDFEFEDSEDDFLG